MRKTIFVLFLTLSVSPAHSWGGGGDDTGGSGGSSGGNCCSVPESLQEAANLLRKGFLEFSLQALMDQQILGTLCESMECGVLTEGQAALILSRDIEIARSAELENEAWWNWLNGFVAALTSIGGFVIGAAGLWIAKMSLQSARQADNLSIQNSVDLALLKSSSKVNGDINQ